MSQHIVKISWNGQKDKEHYTWHLDNGVEIKGSAAPEFGGDEGFMDPEEAFVASLSSCHMLSFLASAAKDGFAVELYEDDAVGILQKNDEGRLAITEVLLQPTITFAGDNKPTVDEFNKLHKKAHRDCFIANSVKSKIIIEPRV